MGQAFEPALPAPRQRSSRETVTSVKPRSFSPAMMAGEEQTFLGPGGMPMHFSPRQEVDELLCDFVLDRVARLELGARGNRVEWVVWAMKSKERT